MTQTHASPSLVMRTRRWRAIGKILVVFARGLLRLQRTRGPGAWAAAEALEVSARAALAELMVEIAERADDPAPLTEADAQADHEMRSYACCLLMLAIFARHMKSLLAGIAEAAWRSPGLPCAGHRDMPAAGAPAHAFAYLDPG